MYKQLSLLIASAALLTFAAMATDSLLSHRHVRGVAFSADGRLLAAALGGGICIWDTGSGVLKREIAAGVTSAFGALALSPDGSKIAAGFATPSGETFTGGIVFAWDVRTGERVTELGRSYNMDLPATGLYAVQNLAYSPDGKYLAICLGGLGLRHKLSVLDTQSMKPAGGFFAGPGMVSAMALSPDGKLAAQRITIPVPRPGPVTVWDLGTDRELGRFRGCGAIPTRGLAFSPDGTFLAAGGSRGTICLYDLRSSGQRALLNLDVRKQTLAVAFSPDGRTLASEASDNTLRVWSVTSRRELRRCTISGRPLPFGAFSHDARSFADGDRDDDSVHLWDVDTCHEVRKFGM